MSMLARELSIMSYSLTVSQAKVCVHKGIWEPLDFTVFLCSFLKDFLSPSFLHFPLPISPFCSHHLLSFCAPHPAIVSLFLHFFYNFCRLSLPQLSFSPLFFLPLTSPFFPSLFLCLHLCVLPPSHQAGKDQFLPPPASSLQQRPCSPPNAFRMAPVSQTPF